MQLIIKYHGAYSQSEGIPNWGANDVRHIAVRGWKKGR